MSVVTGRRWPPGVPFGRGVNDAATGQPYVRDGFVCDSRAGDFVFKDLDCHDITDPAKVDTLEFTCPRTGKYCGSILVGHQVKPNMGSTPTWKWDGNLERPTLEPSINCVSGCGWHGHLQQGEWRD